MTDAVHILQRFEAADTLRSANAGIWRSVAQFADPLRRNIGMDGPKSGLLEITGAANLFDSTLMQANMTYAAGVMSWMTPSESKWFGYDPPFRLAQDDAAKSWYSRCTDIAQQILAGTNFYLKIHNAWLDDGAYGTSVLMVEENSEIGLRFNALPVGTYSIIENQFGDVDTLFQVHRFSARAAAQKFGEGALPEKVRKKLANPTQIDTDDEYLHFIAPREEREPGKIDTANMPWQSVWIFKEDKLIVRESGFIDRPFFCHRHLVWNQSAYGLSPGMLALYDARQLNLMQQYLDTLVEKTVTPPVLAPSRYDGVIDLGAAGVTYFTSKDEMPRHWQNPGNYMVGEDRTVFRATQINRAFHVDLFQALAAVPVGKEMTRAEIFQRQQDRLSLFSPTFARKNHEINNPVMRTVFAMLLRMGAFPPPPASIVQETEAGVIVPDPEIVYTSRLALQIRAINNEAFGRTFAQIYPLAEARPEILDNFNLDNAARMIARNEGAHEDIIRPELDRDAMRQQRAQEEAQAMEEASMLEEAGAVAKLK
jgi:hypothetical protein